MKSNFKSLRLRNTDVRLQSLNDIFSGSTPNKLEEVTDLQGDLMEDFENIYFTSYDNNNNNNITDEGCFYHFHQEKNKFFICKQLNNEMNTQDNNCDFFLNAGYVDCMEEAIRFLVEKENISPEHPMVINLKAHLEKSKEKILGTFFPIKYDLLWEDNTKEELDSIAGFNNISKV